MQHYRMKAAVAGPEMPQALQWEVGRHSKQGLVAVAAAHLKRHEQ
jgi:hypothetical protein